jgi:hypothetical protein
MFERITDIKSQIGVEVVNALEVDSRHVLINDERIFKFTGDRVEEVRLEDLSETARDFILNGIEI